MVRRSRREFISKTGKFAAVTGVSLKYFGEIPEINVAVYEDAGTNENFAAQFFNKGFQSRLRETFANIGIHVNFEGPLETEFNGINNGKTDDRQKIYHNWYKNAPNKSSFDTVHSKVLISRTDNHVGSGKAYPHVIPCECSHSNSAIARVGDAGVSLLPFVVAHEVGHNIGLNHFHANIKRTGSSYKKTIMYSTELLKTRYNVFGQPQPDYNELKYSYDETVLEFNDKINPSTTTIRRIS